MVGVSGGVTWKKVNKDTELALHYDWESYPTAKKYSRLAPLSGNGETYFYIEKHKTDSDEWQTIKSWVVRGGGECSFDESFKDVPNEIKKSWEKILLKYRESNEKKLFHKKMRA